MDIIQEYLDLIHGNYSKKEKLFAFLNHAIDNEEIDAEEIEEIIRNTIERRRVLYSECNLNFYEQEDSIIDDELIDELSRQLGDATREHFTRNMERISLNEELFNRSYDWSIYDGYSGGADS